MLSAICTVEDNRIHSKQALLNYLLKNTEEDLISLKDSIIKLSYSNKVVGIDGEQTIRLPLKSRPHTIDKDEHCTLHPNQEDRVATGRFLSKSLKTVKKRKVVEEGPIFPEFPNKAPTRKGFPPNVKSIKSFYSLKLIKQKLRNPEQPQKQQPRIHLARPKTKSYSQMISEIGFPGLTKLEPIGSGLMLDRISKIAHLTKIKMSEGDQFEKIAYLQNLDSLQ